MLSMGFLFLQKCMEREIGFKDFNELMNQIEALEKSLIPVKIFLSDELERCDRRVITNYLQRIPEKDTVSEQKNKMIQELKRHILPRDFHSKRH